MADVDNTINFGLELKDDFKSVNSWVANGISWLDEVQQFYRERSAIEKDYSAKLNALAKKYHDKKAKKSSSLSVGDTPTMTPGSLESNSLKTWTKQLNTVESRAAEHEQYSTELITQLADPLKTMASRFEDLRKRHAEHAGKLEAERDSSFNDLRKIKNKYDNTCQEVENKRKKAESSLDFSKVKAQNAYQQQILEMNNAKNSYLIAINVTNAQKKNYYDEYLPELLESLRDLSESRTAKLNEIWSIAAQIEAELLKRSIQLVDNLSLEVKENQPCLDSIMFVQHNIAPWQEPPDMRFIPSPVWHDDNSMVVDENANVFLLNLLSKSKAQLGDLRREVDKKRREVESTKRIKQQIREGRDNRDEVEIVRSIFSQQEELHSVDHKRLAAEVETTTITAVVGDITLGAKSHNFKSQTFKIPTNCDLCGERIWGLSAKGFDCRDCGYTCHSKCEMKVPAECPGEQNKDQKKKLKAERQEIANSLTSATVSLAPMDVSGERSKNRSNTISSQNSGHVTGAHRSVPDTKLSVEELHRERDCLSLSGSIKKKPWQNRVVAPPPSTYISEKPRNELELNRNSRTNSVSEQRGRMMYDYEANGDGEVSITEGKEILILEADDGGWTKIQTPVKEIGLVPTAYIELFEPRPTSNHSNSESSIGAQRRPGPPVAPKPGAKKLKLVEAMYDYMAQNETELSILEGERFVLVKEDPGDGWAEVEKGGVVGNVPANYIQFVN